MESGAISGVIIGVVEYREENGFLCAISDPRTWIIVPVGDKNVWSAVIDSSNASSIESTVGCVAMRRNAVGSDA